MNEADLGAHAKLLHEVTDVFSVLIDPAVAPSAGSLAAGELHAARELPAEGGTWGEEPVQRAYGSAMLCYSAALELARAMVALMNGAFSILPVGVLARSLVEVASQAWWLLEPEIGCVRRVRRLQALRHRSASEGERAARSDGAASNEYYLYTETIDEVKEYSRALGLDVPSQDGRVYVCGEERLPTASRRVVEMFDDLDVPSVYKLYSGFPHGELFALQPGPGPLDVGNGSPHDQSVPTYDSFPGAVAVASYALHPPGARFMRLFGLDVPGPPRPE